MQVVRFEPRHLFDLRLQTAQFNLRETLLKPEYGVALSLAGPAFTALLDGRPVGCAGVQELHPRRGEAWALLSREVRPLLRPFTRAVRGWIEQCSYARLEMNVATDFEAGHRWARMLGFQVEGPEKHQFAPDGGSVIPYVRIQ